MWHKLYLMLPPIVSIGLENPRLPRGNRSVVPVGSGNPWASSRCLVVPLISLWLAIHAHMTTAPISFHGLLWSTYQAHTSSCTTLTFVLLSNSITTPAPSSTCRKHSKKKKNAADGIVRPGPLRLLPALTNHTSPRQRSPSRRHLMHAKTMRLCHRSGAPANLDRHKSLFVPCPVSPLLHKSSSPWPYFLGRVAGLVPFERTRAAC